jgi:hypothetical protein
MKLDYLHICIAYGACEVIGQTLINGAMQSPAFFFYFLDR